MSSPFKHELQGDIIEHILKVRHLEENTRRYFRHRSQFFKALNKHIIRTAPLKTSIFCYDPYLISEDARMRYNISFVSASIYGPDDDKTRSEYELEFGVDYHIFETETYRKYRIKVDLDLELNFTQKKFEQWLKKCRDKQFEKECQLITETINSYGHPIPGKLRRMITSSLNKVLKSDQKKKS